MCGGRRGCDRPCSPYSTCRGQAVSGSVSDRAQALLARAIAAAARYGRGEPNAEESLSGEIATFRQVDARHMLAYM